MVARPSVSQHIEAPCRLQIVYSLIFYILYIPLLWSGNPLLCGDVLQVDNDTYDTNYDYPAPNQTNPKCSKVQNPSVELTTGARNSLSNIYNLYVCYLETCCAF